MTRLVALIKSAPLTVISLLAVIAALGFFSWAWVKSGSFRESLTERAQVMRQIENLKEERIQIPGPEAGDEPVTISVPINPETIKALSNLDTELEAEFEAVRGAAVDHNRRGHRVLVEDVIPEPANPTKPIDAREAYKAMLPRLLQSPEAAAAEQNGGQAVASVDDTTDAASPDPAEQGDAPTTGGEATTGDAGEASDTDEPLAPSTEAAVAEARAVELPRLIAAMPPSPNELESRISEFEQEYRQSIFAVSEQRSLTSQEVERLNEQMRGRLREMLYRRAEQIHVYADPDPTSEAFPLHFAPLREADPPRLYQIWEAQLELWIQQDIIEAIGLANNISDPNASVLTGPVKRLDRIEVLPGYVGLHTRGGAVEQNNSPSAPYVQPQGYTLPPKGDVPRNFFVGPTGRVSNSVYDVRHVRVDLVVDYTKLPVLFDAISRVNFMTVIHSEVTNVDEYQAYREGFVYGEEADAVHATLVIESLWLRDWTEPMMPERVKQYLGILPPYEGEDGEGMMPGMQEWDLGPGGIPRGMR